MKLRTLLLALALSTGLSAAAKHPKVPKVTRHAKPSKAAKHPGSAIKPLKHNGQKAAPHASGQKAAKHKAPRIKKHKA